MINFFWPNNRVFTIMMSDSSILRTWQVIFNTFLVSLSTGSGVSDLTDSATSGDRARGCDEGRLVPDANAVSG